MEEKSGFTVTKNNNWKPLQVKDGYHVNCTVSSDFLLDKGRVAENLQKECLCYFIISSTSLWRNHFNHKHKNATKTSITQRLRTDL